MIISKLTGKAQTTVPQAVRRALGIAPGDALAYEIEEGRVILTKAGPMHDDPFTAFGEWASDADEYAYRSL